MPLSQTGAELLFEVFSQRYERGSTIVTTTCRSTVDGRVRFRTAHQRPARPPHPPRPYPGDERRQLPAQAEQAPPARFPSRKPAQQPTRAMTQNAGSPPRGAPSMPSAVTHFDTPARRCIFTPTLTCANVRDGLTLNFVSGWLEGRVRMARKDHYEYLCYREAPRHEEIMDELRDTLRAHRDRTGIGPAILLRRATDNPDQLSKRFIGWVPVKSPFENAARGGIWVNGKVEHVRKNRSFSPFRISEGAAWAIRFAPNPSPTRILKRTLRTLRIGGTEVAPEGRAGRRRTVGQSRLRPSAATRRPGCGCSLPSISPRSPNAPATSEWLA